MNILSSHNLNLVKIVNIAMTKINKTQQPAVCGWTEIEKYLLNGLTNDESKYFIIRQQQEEKRQKEIRSKIEEEFKIKIPEDKNPVLDTVRYTKEKIRVFAF
jgi:hypothetical protein